MSKPKYAIHLKSPINLRRFEFFSIEGAKQWAENAKATKAIRPYEVVSLYTAGGKFITNL